MSEKTPCQYCGKDVTVQTYGRKKHEEACKMNPVNEVVKENKGQAPVEALSKAQLEARELYEISQKAQESRKESPELFIGSQHSDVRGELVMRYAPECIDPPYDVKKDRVRKRAEWHAFFGSKETARLHAHRGYEPVFNEHQEQVTHDGDPLWKIPRALWKQTKDHASSRSKELLSSSTKEMIDLKDSNSIGETGGDVSERKETSTKVVTI